MSDTQSTTDATAATDQNTDQQTAQGDPAEKLGDNGVKALKAEREARAAAEKQAAALKAQLDEIAAANLSDLEKAQKAAADAQAVAERATVEALRFRIAAETGITDNVDLILTASDEDTMRRQAELWSSRTPASDTTAGPRPDLTQGGSGQSLALNSDGLEDALKAKLGIH